MIIICEDHKALRFDDHHGEFQKASLMIYYKQASNLYISGIFFVLPCIETYQKVDLRTITLDVPPQEVNRKEKKRYLSIFQLLPGFNSRLCDRVCGCCCLLPSV